MIPLGITILWHAASTGNLTTAALFLGLAFIGYDSYRPYVGVTRYRTYRDAKREIPDITQNPRA